MKLLLIAIFGVLPLFCFTQPKNGMRFIDFTLTDLKGKEISLSDYKGKVILLDFWASWCTPCREENPNVVEAYNKYRKSKFKNGKGFVVLSVSLDKQENAWRKAIIDDKLSWNDHVWDIHSQVTTKYGVRSIPYSFLINENGEIMAQGEELKGINLHIQIEKLLK